MTKARNIGLFFGSFNPIHNGHLMIANWMAEYTDIDQVWFVISPLNPFKTKSSLLPDYQRLELVNRAVDDYPRFRSSNIEFNLPKPSYTIDTLTYLKELHPDHQFTLIMGSDQLPDFHRWKNAGQILEQYSILAYPRRQKPETAESGSQKPVYEGVITEQGHKCSGTGQASPVIGNRLQEYPSITLVEAPMMEISSSFIRKAIREGKDVRFFLPAKVWEYILEMHFYE